MAAQNDDKKGPIDLDKIILPKKEGPSPASAQRINAGALLEQEQSATLAKPEAGEQKSGPRAPRAGGDAGDTGDPRTFAKQTPAEPSVVKPLETYKAAIEQVVQQKNLSVVSIAAKEAERRAQAAGASAQTPAPQAHEEVSHELGLKIAAIVGGVVLLLAAAGLIAYFFFSPQSAAPVQNIPSPFIAVDDTKLIAIPTTQWKRTILMQQLEAGRESTSLSLGLIERLLPLQASSSEQQYEVDAGSLLTLLAPNAPSDLTRSLSGQYLLGVHAFDGNQALLLLDIADYDQAYSAMLAWEPHMQDDLAPLFTRTPRPHIPEEDLAPAPQAPVFLPSASSTDASSTPALPSTPATSTATSTASTTPEEPPYVPPPHFIDRVVENRDTRVIQNDAGDILLLWTFLDRQTLLITTNEYTLREVVSRIARPPTIPLQ